MTIMTRPTGPVSKSSDFEAVIGHLTQPVGGQYPRPWMTSLRDPMRARVFIVGQNQAKNYPIGLVGSHGRHMDALFNRNGEGCRELYDEITNPSFPNTTTSTSDSGQTNSTKAKPAVATVLMHHSAYKIGMEKVCFILMRVWL
ncbi:MAG: hypothetical protein ACREYA_12975 [Cupriavidus necator]